MKAWLLVAWFRLKVVLTIAILAVILVNTAPHLVRDQLTVKVTKAETRVDATTGKSKYMIWAGGQTFENTDDWMELKKNSSKIYGQLEVGQTYTLNVYGFRSTWLSWYKNIRSVELPASE